MHPDLLLSRRLLLQMFGLGAAALWVRPVFGGPANVYDGGSPDIPGGIQGTPDRVLVIGAGFAGMAAANALQQAGVDVTVIEARERLGGRAWTGDAAGAAVDLGASWIHSPVNNSMGQFAAQAGVGTVPFGQVETIFPALSAFEARAGRFLDGPELLTSLLHMFQFDDALYDLQPVLGPGASIGRALRRYLREADLDAATRRRVDFAIRRVSFEQGLAGRINQLGVDAYLGIGDEEEDDSSGEDVLPVGGYTNLVQAMGAGLDVRSGEVVREIRHGAGGVEIDTIPREADLDVNDGAPRRVAVTTHQGSHAIVTVPLGVLKRGSVKFTPALPKAKRSAIHTIGFGSFEKVVLRFDDAFWRPDHNHVLYGSKRGGEFPIFLDMTDVTGLPTLVAFCSARFAESLRKRDTARIEGRLIEILTELHGSVPAPTAILRTRWQKDPYARGSYSYAGRETVNADYDELTEPVGGRLLFAGEATNGSSTTDGAMDSGIREAKRLLGQASVMLQNF